MTREGYQQDQRTKEEEIHQRGSRGRVGTRRSGNRDATRGRTQSGSTARKKSRWAMAIELKQQHEHKKDSEGAGRFETPVSRSTVAWARAAEVPRRAELYRNHPPQNCERSERARGERLPYLGKNQGLRVMAAARSFITTAV